MTYQRSNPPLALICLAGLLCAGAIMGCAEEKTPPDWNDVIEKEPEQGEEGNNDSGSEDPIDAALNRDICKDGPLEAPLQNCAPKVLPSTGDDGGDCVRRINQLRAECQCLLPLERWTEGEQCAEAHARYDAEHEQPHKGFQDKVCEQGGWAQNECPSWGGGWSRVIDGCLQMMWDEGPGEDFMAHGHYLNMSSQRYTKVACGGADGWFVQNFSND